MPSNRKTKPLVHFPSAIAQGSTPVDTPRKPGFLRQLFRFAIIVTIFFGLSAAGLFYYFSQGPVSNERLRLEIVSALSTMMGPDFSATISTARMSIGQSGLMSIAADNVEIADKAGGIPIGSASQIHAGIELLPLLKGEYKVKTILVDGAVLDVRRGVLADTNWSGEWPDALHLEKLMRIPANRLFHLSRSMGVAGLEEVTWKNLRVEGVGFSEAAPKQIYIHEMVARVDPDTGNLDIEAHASIDSREIRLVGAWEMSESNFALRLQVDGLNARDIFESAAKSREGFLGLDAPVKLAYYHPYDSDMLSMQSTIRVDIADGLIRFGDKDLTPFSGGQFNFTLLPEKNQIELEKSPVHFEGSSAVLTGGIRFPLRKNQYSNPGFTSRKADTKDAENLQKPIFELIANNIIADPTGANGSAVEATFKVGGTLNAKSKIIEMNEINLWTSDGMMQGAGSLGFVGETPSLALALTVPRISVATVKQIWPFFIGTKARHWIMTHVNDGIITNARIDAAIPAGILGHIDHGKKMAPEHISIRLNVDDTNIDTIGELPTVSRASGEVLFKGMKTWINLASGVVQMENGREVKLNDGQIKIGDFHDRPTMADLNLKLSGNASDILWIGSRQPLEIDKEIEISSPEITGQAKIDLNAQFPIEDGYPDDLITWDADLKLSDVNISKPVDGRKISKANVSIKATPDLAEIDGNVVIDGIRSEIKLSQPLGENAGPATTREVKLVLDSKARKKIGLDLDSVVKGQIVAEVISLKEKDTSKVIANLTSATLDLPWVNWSKGKGIKATAEFVMQTAGKRTNITGLTLHGTGFKIVGDLSLDDRGLISANLSQFSLNKNDNVKVKISRASGGYSIQADGSSYDARAIINQVIDEGTPQSKLTSRNKISLKARIAKVGGFGGEVLKDVKIDYFQRNGQLARTFLTGSTAGNTKTALSIVPENGVTTTTLVSSNAGAALRFLDIYSRMSFGALSATFKQKGSGPNKGKVVVEKFWLKNEPRLKRLLSSDVNSGKAGSRAKTEGSSRRKIDPDDVKVTILKADLVKNKKSLEVESGIMRSADIGTNFSGTIYDGAGKMDLRGTYLPGYGLNRIASKIPIVGLAFGDGTNQGFLGITYRLRGQTKNPKISVNPVSVITPGILRKIFETR